jgi:hypothetical protein
MADAPEVAIQHLVLSSLVPAPVQSFCLSLLTSKSIPPSSTFHPHPQYGDILDRLDTKSGIPERKHCETLIEQLRQLSLAAEARAQVCDAAMRELADKRKAIADEERERERIDHELELRKAKAKRDTEERSGGAGGKRAPKPKKRKEHNEALEERLAIEVSRGFG